MADAEADVQPAQAEAAAQAQAAAQGAQGAKAAAPAGQAQGGGAQGTVVADIRLDDPDVVQAVTSADGKVCITRDTLQTGLTADQAQLLWSWAMHQHTRCETAKRATKQFMRDLEAMVAQRGNELLGANRHADIPGPEEDEADEPPPQEQHKPILDARHIPGAYVPYGVERWQRKRIGHKGILKDLTSKFAVEIVEDVCDSKGRMYVVGEESKSTHCGAFPHGLVAHKVGAHRGKEVYVCSSSLDVVITIRLVDVRLPRDDPKRYDVTEKDVLNELARMNRKEVCLGWGDYENSVAFYVELQFYAPGAGGQGRYVCTDQRNEDLFAFKKAPPNGKLLSPAEDRPYARGPQEVQLLNGKAEMQFSFNVINKDLNNAHKKKLFCLTAHCLNPYLNGRANFTATSVPFMIKRSLHNDLVKTDRWVLDETGTKVKVDKSLVMRLAPTRKLAFARKRKADEEPAEAPAEEDESEGE